MYPFCFRGKIVSKGYWCRTLNILFSGVVVNTTGKVHSTKSELRFCAGLNPARSVSEICDGENL